MRGIAVITGSLKLEREFLSLEYIKQFTRLILFRENHQSRLDYATAKQLSRQIENEQ